MLGVPGILPLHKLLKTPQHHLYIVVYIDVFNSVVSPVFFGDSVDVNGVRFCIWGFSEGP